MATPIDDASKLPGEALYDQQEVQIGKVKKVYESDGEDPMWVSVEASFGMGDKRMVFVPIARLKQENDQLRVPYSKGHIKNCPEVDAEDEISAEDDAQLRDHYGIDRADKEIRTDNESYADRVPAERGTASKVSDG